MLKLNKDRVLGLMRMEGFKTQGDLANEMGISRAWLSAILNGHAEPSTDNLMGLCRLFSCTIDDIVVYPHTEAPAVAEPV